MKTDRTRVLLCDDSSVVRRLVRTALVADEEIEVVGQGTNGAEGVELATRLKPDVIVMDVEMPVCDGIEAVSMLKKRGITTPVVMFSSLTARGAEATLDALSAGASDFATKPVTSGTRDEALEHVRAELLPKVKVWGQKSKPKPVFSTVRRTPATTLGRPLPSSFRCVTVGASTGGPAALGLFLDALPTNLNVPVVVVQHMPPVFTARLAEQLDRRSPLRVVHAEHGDSVEPGKVYIAPGGKHLRLKAAESGTRVALDEGPLVQSCRPAVDVLFRSAAEVFGAKNASIVLTGMGQDGLDGARAVRQAGGCVMVQDSETSVVWGMPGVVWQNDVALEQLPPGELGRWVGRHAVAPNLPTRPGHTPFHQTDTPAVGQAAASENNPFNMRHELAR